MIYLDHHATTPVDPAVLAAMLPYFSEHFGNPSSRQHRFGQNAHAALEQARTQVAGLIDAAPEEIVFTSGATESNNLALRGAARALRGRGAHLVTSTLEHPSVREPLRTLEREGFEVTRVGVSADGVVAVEEVAAALRADTVLVSLMAANNEIGTIQPVAAIGALCRARGVVFHCDAVQALGRIPLSVASWPVDLLSMSAHKMYGPKGVGALYIRRSRPRLRLQPQAEGGGQERGVRSGTHNVPGIVGLGVAARLAGAALANGEPQRVARLRDRLLAGLEAAVGGIELNGAREPRLPGNLHVSIAGAPAEPLLITLGQRIALSSGAACAEAEGKGSHVMRALGLSEERVYTALRIGLGRGTTEAEIDSVVATVAAAVTEARARSAPSRGPR